jgi:hypothetical protein
MNCRLKYNPEFPYSNSELRIFSLLSDEPRNTIELANAFYKGKGKPYNPRQAVTTYLMSLDRKMEANKEDCRVDKTPRRGPNPIDWMLVPRQLSNLQKAAVMRNKLKSVKKRIEAA